MPWIKLLLAVLFLCVGPVSLTGCGHDLENPTEFVDNEEDEYWDGYDYDEEEAD